MTRAGNQQGRPGEALRHWLAGFVDGEGSFHIAVQRNPTVRVGWQILPEFHVSQRDRRTVALVRNVFGCGRIRRNHAGSRRDVTWVFVVRNRSDLTQKVLPFFARHPLRSAKAEDFKIFRRVIGLMEEGRHRTTDGIREAVRLAYAMNGGGRRRKRSLEKLLSLLEPSETTRRTPRKRLKI